MKLFNAATALGLSLFGAASADTTKVSRDSFAHRALVEQVGGGPPEGDGKCTKEDLSPEELAAAQAFQTWFVETYFDGDYRAIKDPDGDKLTKLLDVFDTYDLEKDGFLNTAEVAALAADLGLEASFLDAYINCLSQDNLIDEDELLKAVCVGEPHFTTWQGASFDYHGACDLVLINNKSFDGYKGLDLNVRTEQMDGGLYSFVSDAVVRVGADTLEVQKDQSLFFNKQRIDASKFPLLVGGFPATHEVTNKCFDIGPIHKCVSAVTVGVQLGEQENIIMKVFKDMVHVEVTGRPQEMAMGSVGLMGTYPAKRHGRVARDGFTFVQDANLFGQEWQVRDNEAMLFVEQRYPQYPQACIPASDAHASNQRRLRQGGADEEALRERAHAACAHVANAPKVHKMCVFDVMATGDEISAMIYGSW